VRALVVDDAPLARAQLIRYLQGRPGVEVVGEAADGDTALALCAALAPDTLFLDIDMPARDGLSVARENSRTAVVFVSAHAKFAVAAFDIDAVDFVLKPYTRERIDRALERLSTRRHAQRDAAHTLMVAERGGSRFVPVHGVTRFYALDKYTAFLYAGRELLVRESIDTLAARYGSLGFLRTHRAELVQLGQVASLEKDGGGWVVVLADGQRALVSRRALGALREALANV
jgi:two-component system LytT family response regulator